MNANNIPNSPKAFRSAVVALFVAAALGGYLFWAVGEVQEDQAATARQLAMTAIEQHEETRESNIAQCESSNTIRQAVRKELQTTNMQNRQIPTTLVGFRVKQVLRDAIFRRQILRRQLRVIDCQARYPKPPEN